MELSEHLAWTTRAIAELKWQSPHFAGELGEGLFDRTLKPDDPPQRRDSQADRETALAVLAEHAPAVVRAMVQHGIDAAPLDRVTDGSPDPLSHEYAATLQAAGVPIRLLEKTIEGKPEPAPAEVQAAEGGAAYPAQWYSERTQYLDAAKLRQAFYKERIRGYKGNGNRNHYLLDDVCRAWPEVAERLRA